MIEIRSRWNEIIHTVDSVHLVGVDLTGVNLIDANLDRANLSGAILSGADLTGATLRGANLHRAHLGGTNLTGAELSKANLSGAYLIGATAPNGAKTIGQRPLIRISPIGSRGDDLHCWITTQGPWIITGCFAGTLSFFQQMVAKIHGTSVYGHEYLAACDYMDTHIALWAPPEEDSR